MNSKIIAYENVPSLVQIETTYACNHKCAFCYNPKRGIKPDIPTLDKIVDSISKSQIPHVYFIGGEPSLIPVEKLNEYIETLSRYSSMAIVTNGSIRLENLSHKLSCVAIPLHGLTAERHDKLTGVKGSFDRVVENIKYYVAYGIDVRCVLVLTGYNYNEMYEMIRFAANLGMESVYVDRYEDGGIGATVSEELKLKPTIAEFREGVTQILKARDDFGIFKGKIGFGTAIPMCLDERLILNNITSTCGVGTSFCAVNPDGNLRICNQSEIKFGNVMEEPIEEIWKKKDLNIYRDLSWAEEPCISCRFLEKCQCGCKVDVNYSDRFSVDFAVREDWDDEMDRVYKKINAGSYDSILFGEQEVDTFVPEHYRIFRPNPFLKMHDRYSVKKVVTKYRTISIDDTAFDILQKIVTEQIVNEKDLVNHFREVIDERDLREFISALIDSEALDLIGEVS
jgi:radical SAM protein with 4Fe4S-binding SPASM domain